MDKACISLTEQERTIVALLAEGETAKRIAASIDVDPGGVARQIAVCRQKLDARNTAELVAKALSSRLYSL